MTVLLDTSVIINVLRGREDRLVEIENLLQEGHSLCVFAITVGELYAGVRPEEKPKIEKFLLDLYCYDINEQVARRAGMLRNEWRRKGRTLELADMMIAATVLEYGLVLMTDNRKDFPMAELLFYPA